MINKATSRQLQGHFGALQVTKSFADDAKINITGGNYGGGKYFAGVVDVSDDSWVNATNIFYIYLDELDQLILNNTLGFPTLSTKIAKVEIASGIIINIIDERASINGIIDGYQVLFNDSDSLVATGDTVQEALESLDAYISSLPIIGADLTGFVDFDISGGIRNGLVRANHIDDTIALNFIKAPSGIGKTRYVASIPNDIIESTDLTIRLFWSPADNSIGNVEWRISYRSLSSNLDNIDIPITTISYNQNTLGVANRLRDTDNNFIIPYSEIQDASLLIINVEREHSAFDTYESDANLHLVRMEYLRKGIVES
jgi:hypothetical protein